ncbi:Dabb family protein [Kribbella italica]|uniref:Stress-response A/B barrel domain-containing protein n=1 Tax=Kribbella italica TaxID=1540520 RepID=A0A7W9J655_9ACTN|nr:Dabb family protein [Kribbella italica]MBB5836213.1 hypothetical protein [Kribbella italica]
MIHHTIRFTAKPEVTEAEAAAAIQRMRDASARIPAIKSWTVGRDIGGDFEYAAISVMEDLDGYEEMMNHPAHLEIDRAGLPLIDTFMSFDIVDDPDPEISAKIAAIHERRYQQQPDIADLVTEINYSGSAGPTANDHD